MTRRRFSLIAVLLLMGTMFFAAPAQALILQAEDELFFDEYVTEDVYLAGGVVTIQQDIDGDVFVAGGDVTINGVVGGDLFVAGGNVLVNELVRDDVRMIGGSLTLNNEVGGDLIVIGGSADINPESIIQGDVVSISGKTNLYGTVNKSVRGILGRLMLG